jgi:hypothetical protein
MFEPWMLWNIGQIVGFVILLKYIQVQVRDNKVRLMDVYTKAETDKLIDLKLKPYEVGLLNVQKDLSEIKAMLIKLLDAKL